MEPLLGRRAIENGKDVSEEIDLLVDENTRQDRIDPLRIVALPHAAKRGTTFTRVARETTDDD